MEKELLLDREMDKYLFRVANAVRLANLQRDPFKVSKEDVDMNPKDMLERIKSFYEEEYSPVFRAGALSDKELFREFYSLFEKISKDKEIAFDIVALLLQDETLYYRRIETLNQFMKDNPNVSGEGVRNLIYSLYYDENIDFNL